MAYQIKVTPNYYQGTCNAPQEAYLTYRDLSDDPNHVDNPYPDDIAEFDSEEEAQDVIDDIQGDGLYHLAHGEAGSPSYEIVEDFDDGLEDCLDASDLEFDDYRLVDPDNLPDGIQDQLDGLNVDVLDYFDDTVSFIDDITVNGIGYRIAYLVRSVAIQINADDLGCVDWNHAAYFVKIEY